MDNRRRSGAGEPNGRDTILGAVSRGLQDTRAQLQALASAAPHDAPPFVHPPAPDTLAQFMSELERLEAQPHRCTGSAEAHEVIRSIVGREGARSILTWDDSAIGLPGLDALLDDLGVRRVTPDTRLQGQVPCAGASAAVSRKVVLQGLAGAQVGLTGVDVAIAESGTLVVLGGPGRGRLASLLAPVHVAVVFEAQIVRGLGEAIAHLRARYGEALLEDRSSLTCITGPSRTADIELTLTLGVHGPREVHVLVLPSR